MIKNNDKNNIISPKMKRRKKQISENIGMLYFIMIKTYMFLILMFIFFKTYKITYSFNVVSGRIILMRKKSMDRVTDFL